MLNFYLYIYIILVAKKNQFIQGWQKLDNI